MAADPILRCEDCGRPLPAPVRKGGRARRFCNDLCRRRAHRRGARAEPEPAELEPVDPASIVTVLPAPTATRDAQDLAGLEAFIDGTDLPPPDERMARALGEARALVVELRRLGKITRPQFRWRATTLADRIDDGLAETFEGVV